MRCESNSRSAFWATHCDAFVGNEIKSNDPYSRNDNDFKLNYAMDFLKRNRFHEIMLDLLMNEFTYNLERTQTHMESRGILD